MPHYENVPKGWSITKIEDVCIFESGYAFSSESYQKEGTPLVRISNIKEGLVDLEGCVYVDPIPDSRFIIHDGDLLIAMSGATTGKMGIYHCNRPALLNQRVGNIKTISEQILRPEYRNLYLKSLESQILKDAYGGAQPNISAKDICSYYLLLPPVEEQKRIITTVDRLMSYVDAIENGEEDCKDIITKAKEKVLELAIRGKLVPQDPTDEPASELLKRINPKAVASCDNPQYCDLPTGWVVTPISELCDLISGRDLPASDCNNIGRGIPYLIGASNISDGKFDIVRWTDNPQVVSVENDILISCKGTIGEVVTNSLGEIHIARQFMALRIKYPQLLSEEYLRMFIIAIIEGIKNKARGVIPGISREDILSIDLLIPPKFEQKRILARTQDLYQQLERIS